MTDTLRTFTDQAMHCDACDEYVRVDTIHDTVTNCAYFECPECGEPNRMGEP